MMLHSTWTWWAHIFSSSSTYANAYKRLGASSTVESFWNYYNHIPIDALYATKAGLGRSRITAFSLFRDGVLPEWEHPINKMGGEWGCRDEMDAQQFEARWKELAVAAIGEQFDDCVGVRVVNKSKPGRALYKMEVWMRGSRHKETTLRQLREIVPNVTFTYMSHNEKYANACEYARRK